MLDKKQINCIFFKNSFTLRKSFVLFLCLQLLINPFLQLSTSAQTTETNNLNLVKLGSKNVSFQLLPTPATIKLSSKPISFNISETTSAIKLSSFPVSFNIANTANSIKASSSPVSYALDQVKALIKLSSFPVSYQLNSFTGTKIKLTSKNVAYKIYNGIPLVSEVSPNLLPLINDGRTITVSIKGENFSSSTTASIGTLKIITKYISSNEITATIPSNFISKENSFEIFAANPPPEGGVSNGAFIRVIDPIPIAKIDAAPVIGVAPQIVTFDGGSSEDLLAKYFGQNLTFSWNFGDSENQSDSNANFSSNEFATHTYKTPGKYTVTLNVKNQYGKTSTITKQIEIRDKNIAPEGSFETNLTSADVPVEINFTSMVTDQENDEVSYLWNFGDGGTSIELNPKHTYKIPGKYKPTLIVKDSLGAVTNISSVNLSFLPPNNTPIAKPAAIPQNSTLTLNNTGSFTSNVQFLSNGTSDADNEELTYLWEFGDGTTSTEINPKHEYSLAGEYNAKLIVTDIRKGKDTKEIKITISKPSPNAIVRIEETTGNAPFEVIFNGTSSQDYDGKPVTLKWDFGDGTQKTTDSTNSIIKHIYSEPGVYLITSSALTNDNRSKTINPGNIIVVPTNAPVAKITKIEGDNQGVIGKAKVKLSATGSYDPATQTALKYKWLWNTRTFDANGNIVDISDEINNEISSNISETFEYTFTKAGQYTPVLETEKADGAKYQFFGETFTITNNDAPIAIGKVTSNLTDLKPGVEISFDGSESYNTKANGSISQFIWDFGDGEKSTEISPKHTFNKEGAFTPILVITDNENQIGFAQTATIKISKSPEEVNTNNNLSSRTLLQVANQNETEDLLIQSMIQEAINASASTDNIKPEIGQIIIEPSSVRPGDSVKLSAFIRDNIALSNFGYRLIAPSGNIVNQTIRDLINESEDKVLKSELYIEEVITVPQNAIPGLYRINLTATDTNKNQIAKGDKNSNSNEEISVSLEVKNTSSDTNITASNINKLLVPSEVTEITNEVKGRVLSIDEKESEETIDLSSEKFAGFYLRGKNITYDDIEVKENNLPKNLVRQRKLSPEKETEIKYLTNGFEVTVVTAFVNSWVSISPSTMNSLELHGVTERSGYIEIATKGSLSSTYFGNWANTNIYVDSKKVGTISWLSGAAISFDSDTPSTTRFIEFRPVNRAGNEMPQETWTENNIILNKDLTPQVTNYSPKEFLAGRGSFDLVIYGSNFSQSSKVYFGTSLLTPYAASPTQLVVRIPANLVRYPGIQYLFVVNANNVTSVLNYFNVKENSNTNVCSLSKTLPQTYWGADSRTILDGDNVYLTSPTATIRGIGSVTIPFCLDKDYDVKTSVKLTHHKILSGSGNSILFWLDNVFIGGSISYGSESLTFDNLNNSQLSGSQPHELKIQFSGGANDELLVESTTFAVNSGPVLDHISPDSTGLEGQNRILSIYGRYFDQNTIVQIDNEQINRTIVNSGLINITLPEKFPSPGLKKISVFSPGKQPSEIYLTVREKIEVLSGSFKISPTQPFPGSSFDIELQASDKSQDSSSVYTADIGIFDPSGNLLTIPNTSSYYTIKLTGIKNTDKTISFKGSIPLSINSKAGVYKAVASVQKGSAPNVDYSDLEAFKYISAKALGLDTNDTFIPISHKLTFTPKPAVNIVFGIEENNSDNVGFIRVANKLIQSNQSIRFKSLISSGLEYSQNIRYNFKSGDGRESGLISNDNFTFTYTNTNTSSTTPLIYTPQLDIFWAENGTQTKITTFSGITVLVYPNYRPIAIARLLKESYPFYASNPPLKTAFVDSGSYDPNQRFSMAVDYVDSLKNDWKLFELKAGPNENLISLPVDAQISEDKKTFITGNLYTPGTYFAKLTVCDQTGLSDTASTESVTLTKPSQKSIVFATTNPSDKKVFDPKTDATSEGIPVRFSSDVKVLGRGNYTKSYKWDFGDGSCMINSNSELPDDCNSSNPTHFYFDGKRSFNGKTFTDRKSVTPKLSVTTKFENGTAETWEASAGTITFNAEPNFVLLDIKPDKTQGVVPFTVSFMIDSSTAKAVNATVERYEIDWGEGSQNESGNIAFEELINKIFTHAYTTPETYTPKLTVFIKDSSKTFVFNLPAITAIGTGQAGVFLLDDLNSLSFTNQPLVTFMVFAAFPNPNDENNSLRIKVKDENGLETTTELDPSSSSQTLSLSEGKNSYYFESSNSSTETWMSETREIVVDTSNPALELFSPGNEEVIKNNKITIFGTTTDENLAHIEYQVDDAPSFTLLEDDLEQIDENSFAFFKELSGILNGNHTLSVRAKDKAGNITEEAFNIGVGDNVFIFNKVLLEKNQLQPKVIGNEAGHSGTTIPLGEPFKLQTSVKFFGDTVGKKETFADINISSEGIYNNSDPKDLTNDLIINNKEFLNTHFIFNAGDLDGEALSSNIVYRSTSLNQNTTSQDLYTPLNKQISTAWNPGLHKININTDVTSPTGGVSLVNLNNPNDISTHRTNPYNIRITRPVEIKVTSLEPKIISVNENTAITATIKVTDRFSFDLLTRKINLLLDQNKLTKPLNSKSTIENLMIIENSYVVNSSDNRIASINFSFNIKPDILPSQNEDYILKIPVKLSPDIEHPDGYTDQVNINIPVRAQFPAEIQQPSESDIVTSQNIVSAKLIGAANNINQFEKQNVKFIVSLNNSDPIEIKDNSGNNPVIRVTGNNVSGQDINFTSKVQFDLHKLNNFNNLFVTGNAFGELKLSGTYTNIKNFNKFNGTPRTFILLDNPLPATAQTSLKKENGSVALKLAIKNNTTIDDISVMLTPYTADGTVLTGLDDSITNQTFSFINQNGQPKLTVSRKILFPDNTNKVKIEIVRNDSFLKNISDRLSNSLKSDFITRARQEEKQNRTFTITLNRNLKSDCEAINELFNSKININQEVIALKELAGCEAEKIFFTESSNETDSIKLPFVNNGTASIPNDPILGITGTSFQFSDQLTLKDFKLLLKDLKLLSEDNNNGYDLETQEGTYQLLYTIDQIRCALKDNADNSSNLKAQVANPLLTCNISTSPSIIKYISTSIKTNLPYITSLISSSNTLGAIGTTSPQVSISGLVDSILLRGLANIGAIGTLTTPQITGIAFLGLILYYTLSNAQLKANTTDATCTNVVGIIDRRFFIGKDLNNNDIKRINTMVSVSATNDLFNSNLSVIEPLPVIPLQPGIFTGCIQKGQYNFQLQFNGQNTFSASATVPDKTFLNLPAPAGNFWGGVFRKYGKLSTIQKIKDSRLVLSSIVGDIQNTFTPTGTGAYLTRLSLQPNISASISEIAEALRLYLPDTFETGNPNSKGILEPERASTFIDFAIDTSKIPLQSNQVFPLQYVYPNSSLQFGIPGDKLNTILIEEFEGL